MSQATIVIPLLRQRDEWLDFCVRSAVQQTVPSEVIVVTSRETPQSNRDVLARIAAQHSNLRVLLRDLPAAFPPTLNFGMRAATTDRIGILLSDDWLEPECIAYCLPHSADIVSTSRNAFLADGTTQLAGGSRMLDLRAFLAKRTLEEKASYLAYFFLFRRDALERAGWVDETVGDFPGIDDYHLIWTMLEQGASVAIVQQSLYNLRDHDEERLTLADPIKAVENLGKILRKHGVEQPELSRLIAAKLPWFGRSLRAVIEDRRTPDIEIEKEFRAKCAYVGDRLSIRRAQFIRGQGVLHIGDDVFLSGTSNYHFKDEHYPNPELRIGDRSSIGHGCSFHVGRSIVIGKYCRIGGFARLSDLDGHSLDFMERRAESTPKSGIDPIRIGDDVWIGNDALILKGVTIGDRAVVSAMSVVASDVPPDMLVAGNPARVVRALNGSSLPPPRPLPRKASIADRIRAIVGEYAGIDSAGIDLARWADDYGIDSLKLLMLRESCEAELGVRFTDAHWVSFRSFEELASYCSDRGRSSYGVVPP